MCEEPPLVCGRVAGIDGCSTDLRQRHRCASSSGCVGAHGHGVAADSRGSTSGGLRSVRYAVQGGFGLTSATGAPTANSQGTVTDDDLTHSVSGAGCRISVPAGHRCASRRCPHTGWILPERRRRALPRSGGRSVRHECPLCGDVAEGRDLNFQRTSPIGTTSSTTRVHCHLAEHRCPDCVRLPIDFDARVAPGTVGPSHGTSICLGRHPDPVCAGEHDPKPIEHRPCHAGFGGRRNRCCDRPGDRRCHGSGVVAPRDRQRQLNAHLPK